MPVTGYSNIPQVTHLNTFCLYKGKNWFSLRHVCLPGAFEDMDIYII